MLRARRRALRLGAAPARAAADARRGRAAGRLGRRHRDLPGDDVPGAGARGDPATTARASWRLGAHDMGQGAWTALAQIAADGLGLDIDEVEFRSGTSDLPDAGIAGGSASYRDGRHGDPQRRRRRDRQAGGSGHGRPTLAAVRRRQCGRRRARRPAVPARRREPKRELRRNPRPRRPRRNRGAGQERVRPGRAIELTPCTRTGPSSRR